MAVPVYSVGQVLAASDCNLWFLPVPAYKTGSTARTATVQSLDPDLQITLAANAAYLITAGVNHQTTSGTSAFSYSFVIPSGATGAYSTALTEPGPVTNGWGFGWGNTVSVAGSDGLSHGIPIIGTIVTTTGGTFGLQWCCATGSSSITVGQGSCLVAHRVG